MARQARWSLPGHVHHALVRGNNRQPIVLDDEDRRRLLTQLAECVREHGVAVHAYGLMPNQLFLLATPASEGALGRALQGLGRRYVASFNQRHQRSGTLWEGRYRAHMVEEASVLRCMRYVELTPLRNGSAPSGDDQAWSSLAHHIGASRDPLITDPRTYWMLGNTPFDREAAYRSWIEQGMSNSDDQQMRQHLTSGRPLGSPDYLRELERVAQRSLTVRPRGRPRKVPVPG
jgi:putative transposase